ncbi:MAG: hypothetical protein Q4B42_08025, partial [Oscillospiraceae bacterium]|nr:hypothetical protein [Oscillospiraceae bacterium]
FCYFNVDTDSFEIANEDYELCAGSSSKDIVFTCTLHPENGVEPPYYMVRPEAPYEMDYERFVKLLGFTPSEPKTRPFTLSSTIRELRATFAGKLLWSQLQSTIGDMQQGASESEKNMMELSLQDTPLRNLVSMSSGLLPRSVADAIVLLANRKVFAAIGAFFRKK